jgi:hypothetical protein
MVQRTGHWGDEFFGMKKPSLLYAGCAVEKQRREGVPERLTFTRARRFFDARTAIKQHGT